MARSAPSPSLALLPALFAAGLLAAAPASADVLAEGYELVVLGEPTTPAAVPESGPVDLTLTWRVREIFAGEPGSVSIAVRHRALSTAQVRDLGSGERWILLANRDAERTGRWEAGMPLKATPGALDAFRKWSAPPDVRPPRAVGEVVEELRDPAPVEPPAPETVPGAPPPAAEGPIVVEEAAGEPAAEVTLASPDEAQAPAAAEPGESPAPAVAAVEPPAAEGSGGQSFAWLETVEPAEPPLAARAAPAPAAADRLERAAPERVEIIRSSPPEPPAVNRLEPPAPPRVAEARGPVATPPYAYRPVLAPPASPGLPPAPPSRPLGPPPADREDLRKAKSSDDDA